MVKFIKSEGDYEAGKTLVENGKVIGFDDEQIFEKLQRSMDKISEKIPVNDRLGRKIEDLMATTIKKWGA